MKLLNILKNDPWLAPYTDAIQGRHEDAISKLKQLTASSGTLVDFANAHKYFGLHCQSDGSWVFREWAPNATAITLIGDFSDWKALPEYRLQKVDDGLNGVWEGHFAANDIRDGQLYKMLVEWPGGIGERIPAYATRVMQDPETAIFTAQVYSPKRSFVWHDKDFEPDTAPLLIYECHIGMAQEKEGVGTYEEFRKNILPRIEKDGYNAIQIMAIQEHPYYGSFGYHVSSFFAPQAVSAPPKTSNDSSTTPTAAASP